MDIGFPDLSTSRDIAPDATRRRGTSDQSDFSALLDRAVDKPDDQLRQQAADKSAAATDKPRDKDKARRAERAGDDSSASVDDERPLQDADQPAASEPVQQTQQSPTQDQPQNTGENPQQPAQTSSQSNDSQPATASGAPNEPIAAEAAPLLQQASPPLAQPNSAGGAATAPQAADNVPRPPVAPASDAEPIPPAAAIAESKAPETAPAPANKGEPAPSFVEQLAASTAKPSEPALAKSKPKQEAAPATDASATKQPAAPVAVTPAAVEPPAPVVSASQQRDPTQGTPAQQAAAAPASAPQPPLPPQPAVQTPAPSVAPTASSDTDSADDAPIIAMLRAAGAQGQSDARSADSKPADTPSPADDFLKNVQIDAKPAADTQKPETPARPFGALAPGLGLAAQITAQQTPEQANAAERLTQLASAVEDKATDALVKPTDDAKPADTAAPAPRAEPQPLVDAAAQRQAAVDASPAAAAARMARPATHPVVTQVAAQVAQAAADGTDRINIRLSPAELGRIDVKLDFGPDGRVQAVFAAERPQTMELLQRDARDLERALQDAGLRADSGSLSFNLRGQGRDAQNGQTSHGGTQDGVPPEAAASQLQVYSAGLAGSGRLDIRI